MLLSQKVHINGVPGPLALPIAEMAELHETTATRNAAPIPKQLFATKKFAQKKNSCSV